MITIIFINSNFFKNWQKIIIEDIWNNLVNISSIPVNL